MRKLNLLGKMLFSAHFGMSALLIYYILKLDVLPNSMVMIAVAICVLLMIIEALLLIGKKKATKIIAAVLATIFCVLSVVPVNIMRHTNNTLKNLQGETSEYNSSYEVVVRCDDNAEYLNDIAKYKIGADITHDRASISKAIYDIEAKVGSQLKITEYESHTELWDALVNTKEVEAIVIDRSFYEMYEELYTTMGDSIDNYVKCIENVTVTIIVDKPPVNEENIDDKDNNASNQALSERPFVIYVSGIDVAGKITMRSRSDVNILIVINPLTKKMVLATVPRDTYVPFPGVTHGSNDKLTHAGIYGDNCSVSIATLEEHIYTGVSIDRWIRVNFTSLERIVDALGGIEVESKYSFNQNGYHFEKGTNYLNGKMALAFSRNRKSFAEGDQQRGKNQLEVIKGIFNKAISPSILGAYTEIFEEIIDSVQTNLTSEDITGLVKMQLTDGASWDIQTTAISVDYTYDYCYSMPGMKLCVGLIREESRLEVLNLINSVING